MSRAGPPPLICHPASTPAVHGFRAECPECGSFWDLENLEADSRYTERYPSERSHFDATVGALKVATLERWLADTSLDVGSRVVCEVGFGGGHCLARLHATARRAFGIETIPTDLEHAVTLGVPGTQMFLAGELPGVLPERVQLWLFQDCLEHLLEPDPFLAWLEMSSAPDARVLVVAPDGGSRSRRLLGRHWPHRVPDHAFHWTPAGMQTLWARHGFAHESSFRPVKRISTRMAMLHLRQTRLAPLTRPFEWLVPPAHLWFNFGELGMVFSRSRPPGGRP
ncbi:MAG: hypothetical protein ABIS67_14830 [Candidatus Eisenbacteria bacterium]